MTPFFDKLRKKFSANKPQLPPEQLEEQPPRYDSIVFGGLELPDSESTTHFLCLGTTGSGKTIILRLLMQSVLPSVP